MTTDTKDPPSPVPAGDFWRQKRVEELIAEQGTKPYDPAAWEGDPEVTDEELDWWLGELKRLRREGTDRGQ
jgi:hypothetical protein